MKKLLGTALGLVMRIGSWVYTPPGTWFCRLTGMSNGRAARELYLIGGALDIVYDLNHARWGYAIVAVWATIAFTIVIPAVADDIERILTGASTAIQGFTVIVVFVAIPSVLLALLSLLGDLSAPSRIGLNDVSDQVIAVALMLLFNPRRGQRSAVRDIVDRARSALEARLRPA